MSQADRHRWLSVQQIVSPYRVSENRNGIVHLQNNGQHEPKTTIQPTMSVVLRGSPALAQPQPSQIQNWSYNQTTDTMLSCLSLSFGKRAWPLLECGLAARVEERRRDWAQSVPGVAAGRRRASLPPPHRPPGGGSSSLIALVAKIPPVRDVI